MADSDDVAPLIPTENIATVSDKIPDYQDAPLPPIDPPPPSYPMAAGDALPPQPPQYGYPQYQPGTEYYGQYPSTYHPQYAGGQQQQNTNVTVVQQQPNAIYEQRVYTRREEYGVHLVLLFICSGLACLVCWPFALVACILSCVAVCFVSDDQNNPRPVMIAALIFIILSFVIGIPLTIVYFTVYRDN